MKIFPALRADPAREAATERLILERDYRDVPVAHASDADREEASAKRIELLMLHASYAAGKKPIAFEVITAELRKLGPPLRAGGEERWLRIRRRVEVLLGERFAELSRYFDLLGPAPHATRGVPPVVASVVLAAGSDGSGVEILFGRRTIERMRTGPRVAGDLPLFPAPDVAALAALPAYQTKCVFKCCHIIPSHSRPDPDAIQAWADALGSDLAKAAAGARQVLAPVAETGELVLFVFWDTRVSRVEVERVGAAMQTFLGSQ